MRAWSMVALVVTLVPTVTWAKSGDEGRRHLAAIQVYLKDAQSNARVVYQVSEFAREGMSNVERSLGSCERHLVQLKNAPEGKRDNDKLELVERDLRDVRGQLPALRSAVASAARQQIRVAAASVYKSLQRTDDDFGLLAAAAGLSQSDLAESPERQPVKGTDLDDQPEESIPDFLPPRY